MERILGFLKRKGDEKEGHMEDEYELDLPQKNDTQAQKARTRLRYYFPVAMWLPQYNWREQLIKDIVAGFVVGAMIIPQSLAYALLVGIPPINGLYTAFFPVLMYFFFGTSKQLSIGPDALSSILCGLLLQEPTRTGDPLLTVHYWAFLVGLFLLLLGLVRFGFIDNLLSRPMLSGFVNAVAIFIMLEQLDTVFGLPPAGVHGWHKFEYVHANNDKISWVAFSMLLSSCVFLFIWRFVKMKFSKARPGLKYVPEILILVVLGITVTAASRLWDAPVNLPVLGNMDSNLPVPKWAGFGGLAELNLSLPSAITIGVLGFIESSIVAKIYASKHNYSISPNRELVALGLANIFGSFFSTYPTFGSLPRSYVADNSGAQTQFFALVAAMVTLLTILALGPVFWYLPKVVMSAILIFSAYGLIELHEVVFLWKMRAMRDLALFIITLVITLLFGVDLGILAGLGFSLLVLIKTTSSTHIDILGNLPGTAHYRDVTRYPDAVQVPGILVVRINDSLHFANIQNIKKMLLRVEKFGTVKVHPGEQPRPMNLKGVIIHAQSISEFDASAVQVLLEMISQYKVRGISMCFAKLPRKFQFLFTKKGMLEHDTDENHLFDSVHDAVQYVRHGNADLLVIKEEIPLEPEPIELDDHSKRTE